MPDDNPPFDSAISKASGTFLKLRRSFWGSRNVQFCHPSMHDLMLEVFQTDKIHKRNYLKQLQLKEFPSIIKPKSTSPEKDSSRHRLEIDAYDLVIIKEHLSHDLLPHALLGDISSLLTEILAILGEDRVRAGKEKLRDDGRFPDVLWIILDLVLTHVCGSSFWMKESNRNDLPFLRKIFEDMRVLLPQNINPIIPSYLPDLIKRLENKENVEFWAIAVAAHSIAPTIVEQSLDFPDRMECRKALVHKVNEALTEAQARDLESDYDDSNHWHDRYGTLPDECRDYEHLFPDDEPIENLTEVENTLQDFPRLEERPVHVDMPLSSSNPSTFEDIRAIFSDL